MASFEGRPPTNPDSRPRRFYPDVFYHDVRLSYKVNNNYRAYFGIDNIFDRDPPLGIIGNEGGSPFSSIGRYFFAGAQIDF
jgi:outer membrane receptor protein involved in Fe transport